MSCKDCKYFDNSKPIDTIYIGKCEKLHLPLQLNDPCPLFKSKEEK